MKIDSVKAVPMSYPVPEKERMRLGNGYMVKRDAIVVRVEAGGIVGYGESHHSYAPSMIASLINETLSQIVVGSDPFAIEDICYRIYRQHVAAYGTGTAAVIAMSGIEMAIMDIIGKALNVPLYKYLGGKKKKIRCYGGGLALGWQEPDSLADEALKFLDLGFTAIKLRGGDEVRKDIARVQKVREKVGQDIDIMVDANTRYNLNDAKIAIKEFEKIGLTWLEEPFAPDAIEQMKLLNEMTTVPIAAGENHHMRYSFRSLLTSGAIGVVQPDCAKTGGILECQKIAALADTFHLPLAPHTSMTSLDTAATVHLLCSIPNSWFYEVDLMPTQPFRDDLVKNPLKIVDGYIEPNDAPGLGVEVDEGIFEKYPVINGPCYVLF